MKRSQRVRPQVGLQAGPQRCPPLRDLGLGGADDHVVVGRADDRVEVGADRPGSAPRAASTCGAKPGRAVEVGVLRVLRRDPQRHLLAAPGDPQRDPAVLQRQRPDDRAVDLVVPAVQRGHALGPGLAHDLHALVEHPQPLPAPREAVAVGPPLVLVPAGADAHLDPAAGDDVAGGRHLGQVGRVAVAHARAHLAEPDPLGDRSERRHQRPRLVGGLRRWGAGRCGSGRRPRSTPTGRRRRAAPAPSSPATDRPARCRPGRAASPGGRTSRIAYLPRAPP